MYEVEHLIGGQWRVDGQAGSRVVVDPSTGEPVSRFPVATPDEVESAVAAARAGTREWGRTAPAERAELLRAAAAALVDQADELATIATEEMGRPLEQSLEGVQVGAGTLRQYSELATIHRGRSLAGGTGALDVMVHEPRGVVAAITPWNDPVAVSCGLLGAALATGNTVVYKPSERAPATGWMLTKIMARHFPDAVFSMLAGDGSVGAWLAGSSIDVIAHVGSSETGRRIAASAAVTGAKVVLENGGNDPLIVDGSVEPAWAAEQAALGAFANAGQVCVSVERIYVHRQIAEQFLQELVRQATDVTIGPLVDEAHRMKVHEQVEVAVAAGARLLCGGQIPAGPGSFYPPTVLSDCTDDMEVMREETFGPVAPVAVVDSFDEALKRARDSRYGLAATVLTSDMNHAQRAASELPAGTVKINAVFGGAPGGAAHPRGISGQGFGYGPELLDEMTFTKVVHLRPI